MRSPDFLTAVGIGVADLDRSTRYYEEVLGMTKIRTFELEYMDEVMLAHEGRGMAGGTVIVALAVLDCPHWSLTR